jgi:hypothetical protein
MTLHFELKDYPLSTANLDEWLLNGQIEYCLVEDWTAPSDMDAYFTVGTKRITI